jgi:hypothetical protein
LASAWSSIPFFGHQSRGDVRDAFARTVTSGFARHAKLKQLAFLLLPALHCPGASVGITVSLSRSGGRNSRRSTPECRRRPSVSRNPESRADACLDDAFRRRPRFLGNPFHDLSHVRHPHRERRLRAGLVVA